jgi:hypothetical protein
MDALGAVRVAYWARLGHEEARESAEFLHRSSSYEPVGAVLKAGHEGQRSAALTLARLLDVARQKVASLHMLRVRVENAA